MYKIFSLEPFSSGDKTFVFRPQSKQYNIMGYIVLEDDYDIQKVKDSIIERGIKQYKKLRSLKQYKFFDFWWKEIPLERCLNELSPFESRVNQVKFDSNEDWLDYSYNEMKITFNLFKELPYKFIFLKNTEGSYKNLIIFKTDHLLSDGLGFVGLFSALGENYDIKLFPQSMKKNSMTLFQLLVSILQAPYLALYSFYYNLIRLDTGMTPFKSLNPITGFPKIAMSNPYSFKKYSEINKKLGITFNDWIMSLFSVSIKKYSEKHLKEIPELISTVIPVSNRALPKDIKNLVISNDTSVMGCELNLISDPIKEYDKVTKIFKKHVRNIHLLKVNKFMSDMLNDFIPYYFTRWLYETATQRHDITFSNIALPKEPLMYAGYKVKSFLPIMSTGLTYAFIGIYSYNGEFRVTLSWDRALEMNPNSLLRIFEEEIDKIGNINNVVVNSGNRIKND